MAAAEGDGPVGSAVAQPPRARIAAASSARLGTRYELVCISTILRSAPVPPPSFIIRSAAHLRPDQFCVDAPHGRRAPTRGKHCADIRRCMREAAGCEAALARLRHFRITAALSVRKTRVTAW